MPFLLKSEDQRYVLGEVAIPGREDTDGEFMTSEAIKEMAERFLKKGKIDVLHQQIPMDVEIVRSFYAMPNDPDGFIPGSWVLGALIKDETLWQQVKAGDLNGWSWFGDGTVSIVPVSAPVYRSAVGKTEVNHDHIHDVSLQFEGNNQVIPTVTGYMNGHVHPVEHTTSTEERFGHTHRLLIDDIRLIEESL